MCDARGGGRGGEQEGAAFKVLLTVASQEAYPVLLSSVRAVKSSSSRVASSSCCFRYILRFFLSLARGSFYAERLHHAHDRCTPIIKVCTRDGVTVRSDHGRRGPRRVTRAAAHASRVTHSESDPAPSLMVAVAGTRRVLGDQDDDYQREQRQSDYPQHDLVREGAAHHLADQRARTYVETKQKTRWDRLRPAGPSEAAFRVRPCLRLPRAPASLGQSAG